jgi:hypothetical protein
MTTQRSRRHNLSYASDPTPGIPHQKPLWRRQLGEPFADPAGRPDPATPGPCSCPPHRRAPRSRQCRHGGRGRGTRGHRRGTPTSTPDFGQRTRGRHKRGHWTFTPDTGHVDATEHVDKATEARQASGQTSRTTTTTRLHTGTPDRGPVGGACALAKDDGSATVRSLPARDCLPHYQAPARPLRRPSRALAHCSPRTITGRA